MPGISVDLQEVIIEVDDADPIVTTSGRDADGSGITIVAEAFDDRDVVSATKVYRDAGDVGHVDMPEMTAVLVREGDGGAGVTLVADEELDVVGVFGAKD